jgi:hypothetical protein
MSAINAFLLEHDLRIAQNPCISPDFCLDWPALSADVTAGRVREYARSRFATAAGEWTLLENASGDCAWKLHAAGTPLADGVAVGDATCFPATWANLLTLKNLIQEHDPGSTIFPTAGANLGRSTLGVGARFTTLHWPAVEWAMSALEIGMSHGCVLSKLKTGFHARRIAWSFNADHQPIGGKFDAREDALVRGCLLASYITFDLSPELALNLPASLEDIPTDVVAQARARVAAAGLHLDDASFTQLLATVWTPMCKMQRRDQRYAEAREAAFTSSVGRTYLRELSIDELPGLTTPETTAIMLALCEVLGMPVNFVAPAFGFQKNTPYPDNDTLRTLIERQWNVCRQFGASIGFHSGSGKSAENYQVMGEVTGGALEIKTSGRYTYEMGVALSQSTDATDAALWRDWYTFTIDMAVAGAFSPDVTEQKMARTFVETTLAAVGKPVDVFVSSDDCRAALEALPPSPEHMVFFEYNFLYVLAAGGRPEKSALGDHTPAGYAQRARFYAISPEARLRFSRGIAAYLVFLAETTGLASRDRCEAATQRLERYTTLEAMLDDIAAS